MLAGAVLLTVSVVFRTIDLPLCGVWPTGTHYVWHTLNGCLLFWLLHIAIKHGRRDAGPEAGKHKKSRGPCVPVPGGGSIVLLFDACPPSPFAGWVNELKAAANAPKYSNQLCAVPPY